MKIKNISFDLWMTLIRSHPEFKLKRAELIADTFNIKHISPKEIDSFIRSVDNVFDRYNMISGKKLSANKMYRELLQRLVPQNDAVTSEVAIKLREQADTLFLEYRPVFMNDSIPQILSQLREEGYILNLSSNTGFIEGETLRTTLADLGIIEYFDFLIFSDEIDASKPSSHFFQHVYNHINAAKNEVLHIGDNPKADYQGAKNFGFNALLITDPNYTINDIRTKL
ncbi:putative hydrolase of the HAD superfamily [Dysgonomonas alginatilytica]|uniref:Putative hydrolase of the HAD superfamily n=1 Tax=Dysgonomonas alginatilytica TaxID=1605892 RepID=A0A2V3PN09_9BACT|nr:HAD-IA family hydrolase [Dysgonomonas alginatilytica]PXV61869.1 putative hydrolase of the HAD superfamily [Dysgonomonas alginatilytica]